MTPLQRAELSLEGLSIGDAFGQRYFGKSDVMLAMIGRRALPMPPWEFTDDTVMAIGIVETLRERAFSIRIISRSGLLSTSRGIHIAAMAPWRAMC